MNLEEKTQYPKKLNLTLDVKRWMTLKIIQSQTGVPMTYLVRQSVDRYLGCYLNKRPELKQTVETMTAHIPEVVNDRIIG